MAFYISDDLILACIGLILFYVAMYYFNKWEDKHMRQAEESRLATMSAEEREAEQIAKKNEHDFMRGVGKYPNI